MHRTKIIARLREYIESGVINESNWSHAEGWPDLESLISTRPGVYGTAAAWVCAIATEFVVFEDDTCEAIADDVEHFACRELCLAPEQWESIEGLSPRRALERIESLCFEVAAA